ncbi:MAG: YbjN domain-containing protein [Clostridia bacterium]|nr:YbjN domain-containing protein [Clostridia bacterium]
MTEEMNMQKAKEVFDVLVTMLDTRDWKYEKHEEKLLIKSGIKGDDLPVEFIMVVKPRNEVVQFISMLPFNMPEDKRVDGAIAVCAANYGLVDGSFDYDLRDGEIIFRMTSSYRESTLSEDLFEYMIMVAASTVDQYNDKFFMLAKGMMTVQQFLEQENA